MKITKSLLPQLLIFIILGILLLSSVFFLRLKTADTRSKATMLPLTIFPQQRTDDQSNSIDILIQKDPQDTDVVKEFSFTVKISRPQVLGATTLRTPHPATIAKEAIRCYNQVVQHRFWPNSCKGIPSSTNCQTGEYELTSAEQKWYNNWLQYGKPTLQSCLIPSPFQASPKPIATSAPTAAGIISTPTNPPPSLQPTLLYNQQGIVLSTTKQALISFDEPRVTIDQGSQAILLHLNGRVSSGIDREKAASIWNSPIVTIKLPKVNDGNQLEAIILDASIKGTKAIAPQAIIELLIKEEESSTPSATLPQ